VNPAGIGDRLQHARQTLGLSLEDIEAGTRIRRHHLKALEDDAFDRLPGPVYAKGFLGGYAAYLGFSQDEIQAMYRELAGHLHSTHGPVDVRITPVTPHSRVRGPVLLVGLAVLAGAVYFSYVAYEQFRQFAAAPPSPPSTSVPAGPSGPPTPAPPAPRAPSTPAGQPAPGTASGAPPPQAVPAPSETVFPSPLVVSVQASDRSWVRAVADGVTVFEGFLSAGDHQVWQANHSLTVRVGNAGALTLTVDGQSLGKFGSSGDVVDRVFTAAPP
jgi:cytoskeletal protein RodZ